MNDRMMILMKLGRRKDPRRSVRQYYCSDCNDGFRSSLFDCLLKLVFGAVARTGCQKRGHHTCDIPKNQIGRLQTIDLISSLLHHPCAVLQLSVMMTLTNEQTFSLRPAQPEDAAFLYELYCSARAEEMAAWEWDEAQRKSFLDLQFRGQQAHYAQYPNLNHQIILDGNRPIGRVLVSNLESEIRLADISLLTEARGKGIGGKLIADLQHEATRTCKPLRLHVEKSNRARRLYQRLGFVIIDDLGLHYFMEWQSGNNSEEK